jgi:dTDP-4-amino-4,6-dideoxygalactose transaminase
MPCNLGPVDEVIRVKGTDRAKLFRGEGDKSTWDEVGSSSIPGEIVCAFLYAQIEAMDAINARRRAIERRHREGLPALERGGRLRPPVIPEGRESQHHISYIVPASRRTRDAPMAFLEERGVKAACKPWAPCVHRGGTSGSRPAEVGRAFTRRPSPSGLSDRDVRTVSWICTLP